MGHKPIIIITLITIFENIEMYIFTCHYNVLTLHFIIIIIVYSPFSDICSGLLFVVIIQCLYIRQYIKMDCTDNMALI